MPSSRKPTLYELQLWDAITSAFARLNDRERLTASLDRRATRSLFLLLTPSDISNKDLMDILMREQTGTHSVAENDSLVRHYRQIGAERTLKIETARYLVVRLLNEDYIPKAEAVRIWYYALIQYAAAEIAVREVKAGGALSSTFLNMNANRLMEQADQFLGKTLDCFLAKSNALYAANAPLADRQQFLDVGTIHYRDGARMMLDLISTHHELFRIADELEKYTFD
jgi:hypothetical protein